MSKVIDWYFIMNCYNEEYETNYVNIKLFLTALYHEHWSMYPMEETLGVCRPAIAYMMRFVGIKIQPKGWSKHNKKTKKLVILAIPPEKMKEMTISEIARKSKSSPEYVCRVLLDNNRKFKRRARR